MKMAGLSIAECGMSNAAMQYLPSAYKVLPKADQWVIRLTKTGSALGAAAICPDLPLT